MNIFDRFTQPGRQPGADSSGDLSFALLPEDAEADDGDANRPPGEGEQYAVHEDVIGGMAGAGGNAHAAEDDEYLARDRSADENQRQRKQGRRKHAEQGCSLAKRGIRIRAMRTFFGVLNRNGNY